MYKAIFFFTFRSVHDEYILSSQSVYCIVIKNNAYRKHIAQCNHKSRQDTYKSSEEAWFNSDGKEKRNFGAPEIWVLKDG